MLHSPAANAVMKLGRAGNMPALPTFITAPAAGRVTQVHHPDVLSTWHSIPSTDWSCLCGRCNEACSEGKQIAA